eukprot:PhF_6_TR12596/c0_g1_i1/m.19853/K10380/ANK; ankyrin
MPPKRRKEIEDPNNTWDMQFMAAVLAGNKEEAENVLEKGAKVDHIVKGGTPEDPTLTSPWHAVAKKADTAMMTYLAVDKKCDVNAPMEKGWTMVHWAVVHENAEVLAKLLEFVKNGLIPNLNLAMHDQTGATPTLLAIQRSNVDMAKMILRVNSNSFDFRELVDGTHTLCQRACATGELNLVDSLLSVGDQLYQTDMSGNTLLHLALPHRPILEHLLDRGMNINVRNAKGQSALLYAMEVRPDSLEDVTFLVGRGVDVNMPDNIGLSPLQYAVTAGSTAFVKKLIEVGADVNLKDRYGSSALHWASSANVVPIIELLFSGKIEPELNCQDLNGDTPLHRACFRGSTNAAQFLLQKEAIDPNLLNSSGRTALHVAAVQGHHGCAQLLVKRNEMEVPQANTKKPDPKKGKKDGAVELKKTEVECEDSNGKTPLQLAAVAGHVDVLRLLTASGGSIHRVSAQYGTLLHETVSLGNVGIVKAILDAGADVNARDPRDCLPLHIAVEKRNYDMTALLLDSGSAIDFQDVITGRTPLHISTANGDENITQLLIDKKAATDTRDNKINTALHNACRAGSPKLVELLLSRKCKADVTDASGCTPLHIACEVGNVTCLNMLLEYGVNTEAKDGRGWRPIHTAAAAGNVECVEVLLSRGVTVNEADNTERSPMFIAAEYGQPEVAKKLVKQWELLKQRQK